MSVTFDASPLDALRRRPRATSWAICTLALLAYLIAAPSRGFGFDAGFYFLSRETFDNWVSFTDFDDPLRGYAFPWTLRVFSDLLSPLSDDPDVVVRVLLLILVPLLLCVLVPAIARRVSSATTVTIPRLLVLNALFFLAWHNDLLYPLSDIPALFLMAVGVHLVLRTHSIAGAAGAGLAFGLAFNYRPAYLLAVGTGVVLLFLVERDVRRLVLRTIVVVAFMMLVLAPQVAINLEHFDTFSPTPEQSSRLTRLQLKEGLALDRYDTYVGDSAEQPGAMRFENRALEAALTEEFGSSGAANTAFESIPSYLGFAADHPADVGASYARHLINGLDTRFGGTYVQSVDDADLVTPLITYFVLAVAVASLCARWSKRATTVWRSPTTWFAAVLLASCVPGVVGAVETRFLMPLHLTLLAAFALCVTRADLPATASRRTLTAVGIGAAVVASFAFTAGTMSSLQPRPMSVDGRVIGEPVAPPTSAPAD